MLPHRCRVLALGHESLSSELLPSIIVSAETILAEKFIPIMPLLCRTLFVMIVQAYNLLGALQSAWLGRMAYLISSFYLVPLYWISFCLVEGPGRTTRMMSEAAIVTTLGIFVYLGSSHRPKK